MAEEEGVRLKVTLDAANCTNVSREGSRHMCDSCNHQAGDEAVSCIYRKRRASDQDAFASGAGKHVQNAFLSPARHEPSLSQL